MYFTRSDAFEYRYVPSVPSSSQPPDDALKQVAQTALNGAQPHLSRTPLIDAGDPRPSQARNMSSSGYVEAGSISGTCTVPCTLRTMYMHCIDAIASALPTPTHQSAAGGRNSYTQDNR